MGHITVCDFPGCGEVVEQYSDKLRMNFAMLFFDSFAAARASDDTFAMPERDPESMSKDLCRKHAIQVRNVLEAIFSGELVV